MDPGQQYKDDDSVLSTRGREGGHNQQSRFILLIRNSVAFIIPCPSSTAVKHIQIISLSSALSDQGTCTVYLVALVNLSG